MARSKNARTPTGKKTSEEQMVAHAASGPANVFIPLRAHHVYFSNPLGGPSEHLKRDTDLFFERVLPSAKLGLLDRMKRDLAQLHAMHPGEGYDHTSELLVQKATEEE